MIVVDSSALIAIVDDEPGRQACAEALAAEPDAVISAGTLAEAMIVAAGREMDTPLADLVNELELVVVPVTFHVALEVGQAYRRWGKGFHPARLNFGDCFAYVTAMSLDCPLLFIGDDFGQTDIRSVL